MANRYISKVDIIQTETIFDKIGYSGCAIMQKNFIRGVGDLDKSTHKYLKIGGAVLITIIVLCMGYNIYSEKKFETAKQLYSEGEYFQAGMELDNLLYFGNDKYTFDKIKYSGRLGDFYEMYSDNIEDEDYEYAITWLLLGIRDCVAAKDDILSRGEKDALDFFEPIFYNSLNDKFGISSEEAERLVGLERKEQDEEIKQIAEKYTANKKVEQEKDNQLIAARKNPIEFKDLAWDNNSSYNIATGSVYNKSDITIKFVEIKVAFKDANGNVIDTTSTYAVGSEGLAPGESTKWEASVDYDTDIDSFSVSLIDFN